jgi:hypothetical protein
MRGFSFCLTLGLLFFAIEIAEACAPPPTANWIKVESVQDLQAVESTGFYWLCNDLDLEGVNFTPLPAFSGVFDGNFKSIDNLRIVRSTTQFDQPQNFDLGLFSAIQAGSVKNLKMKNARVEGVGFVGILAGSIFGFYSRLENIEIDGSVKATSLGGLISGLGNIVQANNLGVSGTVEGVDYMGGFFGAAVGMKTSHIRTIEGESGQFPLRVIASNTAGGFAGYYESGWTFSTISGVNIRNQIETCDLEVMVRKQNDNSPSDTLGRFGGLVGYNFHELVPNAEDLFESPLKIENCFIHVDLQGDGNTGGMIGELKGNDYEHGAIESSLVSGRIVSIGGNSAGSVGGIIGKAEYFRISQTELKASVSLSLSHPDSIAGGLLGSGREVALSDNLVSGELRGKFQGTGGLVGVLQGGYAFNNFVSSLIEGDALFDVVPQIHGNNFFIQNPSLEERLNQSKENLGAISLEEAQVFHHGAESSKIPFDFATKWRQIDGRIPELRLGAIDIADINDDHRLDFFDVSQALSFLNERRRVTPRSYGNFDDNTSIDSSDLQQMILRFQE